MRTVVFINTHSRQGAANVDAVRAFFERKHSPFKLLDFIVVENLKDFDACIKKLKQHTTVECVIVGSGDGTIVTILNALKDRKELTYGFLPLGTSNTFVKSLGLPSRVEEVLELLPKGHVNSASLGSINGKLFANIADIGVPTKVAENVTNKEKKYLGPVAYVTSGIREMLRHDAIWCELEINGKRETFYTHQVLIANGKYRGPIAISKKTSAFSDTLTLGYSASISRWTYAKDMLAFLTGKKSQRPSLVLKPIESAVLLTKPVQNIQADGEVIGKTPAKIKIIKNAIQVITAPVATGSKGKPHTNPR